MIQLCQRSHSQLWLRSPQGESIIAKVTQGEYIIACYGLQGESNMPEVPQSESIVTEPFNLNSLSLFWKKGKTVIKVLKRKLISNLKFSFDVLPAIFQQCVL